MEAEEKVGRGVNSQESDTNRHATEVGKNVQDCMRTHGRPLHVDIPNLNEVVVHEAVMHDHWVVSSKSIIPYEGPVAEGSPMGVEFQHQPLTLIGELHNLNKQTVASGISERLCVHDNLVSGKTIMVQRAEPTPVLGV
ncbi:hypothetical protein D8674_010427 [Pyrus ussuriensis x Pyrus communis]|uniref:Uncharacterized protein n=1 Tax=Pyrus ussuriensis x Pyrus communis TaxID=2448454 RepID=A0A5N5FAP3_9ROSA|nr:hypothetical protein D8674_010427 [Pyrus ussuriensis x Pyrus communis]